MLARKVVVALLMVCIPAGVALGEDTPSPELSEEEYAELIQMLDESFLDLQNRISGLSDEQWNFKQNEDRWSVAECTEHIVRSCYLLFQSAKQALESDPDDQWFTRTDGKAEFLVQIMPNRNPGGAGGATAPQEIRPTENWDRATAIQNLYNMQGEVRAYVETLEGPVKNHTLEHPFPVFGWLNAYDWLIYVPLHMVRHTRQIIEVQEDPNYPKS